MGSGQPVNRRARHRVCLLLPAFALIALPSCEQKRYEQIPLYPVRGKVLFDGQPAAGARIQFHPVTPSERAKYPSAKVEADGSFALTTFENKDGAPPGEYLVTVRWDDFSRYKDEEP